MEPTDRKDYCAMNIDWKQQLSQLAGQIQTDNQQRVVNPLPNLSAVAEAATASPRKPMLTLFYEKRRGKPSTIICGFEQSSAESKQLASLLKQRLACGGSERDGEILLQGDVRDRVRPILKAEGYKVKN